MNLFALGNSELDSSRLVHDCMRLCSDNSPADRGKGQRAIRAGIILVTTQR